MTRVRLTTLSLLCVIAGLSAACDSSQPPVPDITAGNPLPTVVPYLTGSATQSLNPNGLFRTANVIPTGQPMLNEAQAVALGLAFIRNYAQYSLDMLQRQHRGLINPSALTPIGRTYVGESP
jgi:hypothetical protein